jgi:aspartyl-tRNA(Asn)/glutamyl-tRNA(Gln) amidotransferase subunit B
VDDSALPNTAICPICTGQPGALPALNAEAVRLGVRLGLALHCRIPDVSHFDRKNYFYPDLPKGYQISQYDHPLAEEGFLDIDVPGGVAPRASIRVHLERAHLEEDAAKNIHDKATDSTLVDFNRGGTPLVEIVTKPDLRSPIEAKTFLQELQAILRAVGSSDADMEKGFMRCDANISLLPIDEQNLPLQSDLNPKTEVKNLNSFKAVERALAYEIKRQGVMHAEGKIPQGATRGWDENKGETFEQRLKETNADYRYFPEPDLPPLFVSAIREEEAAHLPEVPSETRRRLMNEWGFSESDAQFFVSHEGWANFAETVMGELGQWLADTDKEKTSPGDVLAKEKAKLAKLAGGWLTSKLAGLMTAKDILKPDERITPENMAEFLTLLYRGTIASANGQKLLELMLDTKADPSHLLEEHNLGQNDDPKELEAAVTRIIEQNPDQVAQVKAGKLGILKWFVGGVMKATEGKANPEKAEAEVKKQLGV